MLESLDKVSAELKSSQEVLTSESVSILRDFEIFLDFIAANELTASGKNELLPLNSLSDLNALLTKPFDIALKRPVQKSFANINGLFLLARTSGLLILQKDGNITKFAVEPEALKLWQSLNQTERYFTLVETWIVRSSVGTIGEHDGHFNDSLMNLVYLYDRIKEKGLKFKDDKAFFEQSLSYFGLHNIALAEMCGWLEIKHGAGEKGKNWIIKQIKYTDFGLACLALLRENFKKIIYTWRDADTDEEAEIDKNDFNFLQPVFQPYFPKWKHIFRLPEAETVSGIYIFKVSLDKSVWRRIAVSSDDVLDDLHDAIQAAFDFDNDHLYEFSFRNRFGKKQRVPHPMCEEEFSTDEFKIEELPLRIGETMKYVFDFGDNWQFKAELEEIQPPNPKFKHAEILEEHGKAPEQYPEWDDEEW